MASPDMELQVAPASAQTVALALVPPAELRGQLLDASLEPVAGATLLLRKSGHPGIFSRATAGEDGSFDFTQLSPGSYRVEPLPDLNVLSRGAAPVPAVLWLEPGDALFREICLGASACSASGSVVDERGRGVGGVPLICADVATRAVVGRARTQADGGFRFLQLPAITLELRVEARALATRARGGAPLLARGPAPVVFEPRTRTESRIAPLSVKRGSQASE